MKKEHTLKKQTKSSILSAAFEVIFCYEIKRSMYTYKLDRNTLGVWGTPREFATNSVQKKNEKLLPQRKRSFRGTHVKRDFFFFFEYK